jgi:NAD(P)-dependent dehydrogenase (short-subunit alcohol dehydrogenase family)
VVVNNRNRTLDAHGRGPADHVVDEITSLGGEAVADYADASDPAAGSQLVAAAMDRWGRLDICVANAGVGTTGMFHKQPAEQFEEILTINLLGPARLARAALAVMRPAGYGRIVLVASTGGLYGDVGLSAYAASKGGLLALGRSLALEGVSRGVLTNLLLPYATTQMTADDLPEDQAKRLPSEAVSPVLAALVAEDCRLNGEYVVTGAGRVRRAAVGEGATIDLPDGALSAADLERLLAASAEQPLKEFPYAVAAFTDLFEGSSVGGRHS